MKASGHRRKFKKIHIICLWVGGYQLIKAGDGGAVES
jgi:hypothetical protein